MFPRLIDLPDSSYDSMESVRETLGIEVEPSEVDIVEMSHDEAEVYDWYEIFKDEDMDRIWQYYPEQPPDSIKSVADWINRYESNRADHSAVRYVVRYEGEIAGQVGLNFDWSRSIADMQVWLREKFWGSGLAYYAYPALTALAFRYLEVDLALATHIIANDRVAGSIDKVIAAIPEGLGDSVVVKNGFSMGGEIYDVKRITIERERSEEWREENPEFFDAFMGRIEVVP